MFSHKMPSHWQPGWRMLLLLCLAPAQLELPCWTDKIFGDIDEYELPLLRFKCECRSGLLRNINRSEGWVSDGVSGVQRIVFMHLPKTAGTAWRNNLQLIARSARIPFHCCHQGSDPTRHNATENYTQGSMIACLKASLARRKLILHGEFHSRSFDLLMILQRRFEIWTMLRNPIIRSVSHLEHCKANGEDVLPFLGEHYYQACRGHIQRSHCAYANSLMTRTWGRHTYASTWTEGKKEGWPESRLKALLLRVLQMIGGGALHLGIAEHLVASSCLFMHETQIWGSGAGGAAGTSHLIQHCCREEPTSSCKLLHVNANRRFDAVHYWSNYLQYGELRKIILRKQEEDCVLYQLAFKQFVQRVRDMERARNVQVLPPAVDGTWSCQSWMASFVTSMELPARLANIGQAEGT